MICENHTTVHGLLIHNLFWNLTRNPEIVSVRPHNMMGNPSEVNGMNGGVGGYGPSGVTQAARYREQQKATFSGMTALIGVVALVVDIVAVAVPHWGYYSPLGPGYYSQGKEDRSTGQNGSGET